VPPYVPPYGIEPWIISASGGEAAAGGQWRRPASPCGSIAVALPRVPLPHLLLHARDVTLGLTAREGVSTQRQYLHKCDQTRFLVHVRSATQRSTA
jgi:hypothetical protein